VSEVFSGVASIVAKDSQNIHEASDLLPDQHIGSPLYFRHGPNNDEYMMIPVMDFSDDHQRGGSVLVVDRNGCPVTSSDCSFDANSVISLGDNSTTFYPTQISSIESTNGGIQFIITGMGVGDQGTRTPMVASIQMGAESVEEHLENHQSANGVCSLDSCQLVSLQGNVTGDALPDTAGGMLVHNGALYFSAMTKANSEALVLYRSEATAVQQQNESVDVEAIELYTQDTLNGRIVTAMADRPVHMDGSDFVPVCLSRTITCDQGTMQQQEVEENESFYAPSVSSLWHWVAPTCYAAESNSGSGSENVGIDVDGEEDGDVGGFNPMGGTEAGAGSVNEHILQNENGQEGTQANTGNSCNPQQANDGKIYLYDLAGVRAPILLANHNYACNSLQNIEGSLLVSGRLTTQIISNAGIELAVQSDGAQAAQIYTDEMTDPVNGIYADGFYVDEAAFTDSSMQEVQSPIITWNSGTHVQAFPDGTLGVSIGNRTVPFSGGGLDQQNVITVDVQANDPGGRIVSNIQTDWTNLNQSDIRTAQTIGEDALADRSVLLAGELYANPNYGGLRTAPMPIPSIFPSMDEQAWQKFFVDFYHPSDIDGQYYYNQEIPSDLSICGQSADANLCTYVQ
jgi:hypothetical protein